MKWSMALLSCIVCAAAIAPSSCLPADTRPAPARIDVSVSGSPLVTSGIASDAMTDGWSVSFDRVLVSLGNASVDGDACTNYSEADYRRIFDASIVQPKKLATLYGLGTCGFVFREINPSLDSVLSDGVSNAEMTTMITPGHDQYTDAAKQGDTGITVWFRGNAQKAGVTKTFDWSYRLRRVFVRDCVASHGASPLRLSLQGGDTLALDIELHPEVLFHDRLDPITAQLRFQPFADADDEFGNKDGAVTLDELGNMTLENAGVSVADITIDDAAVSNITTFEDFVYLGLFPQIARLAGTAACTIEVKDFRED